MAGPDLSVVTALVEFQTVLEAVLYVAVALMYVYVLRKGIAMIKRAIAGGDAWESYDYEDDCRDRLNAGMQVQSRAEWDKYNP